MEIRVVKDKSKLPEGIKEAVDLVDKLTAPKERSKEYKDMMAKHKKILDGINREGHQSPWEWSFGLDYFVAFLRFMKDYYTLGENVWSVDDDTERLETISKALEYYDTWQTLEEEYIRVVHHPETRKTHDNEDGTVTVDDLGYHCEYRYGSMKKTYKRLYKAQKKYKKLFFDTVAENIEKWWD